MSEPACQHPNAYVICEDDDISVPASTARAYWECTACGAKGGDVGSIDVATADLQASRAVKH